MRLLTNNRKHLVGLRGYGLEVTALEPIPRDNPPPLNEVSKPKKHKVKSA
jgi:GTP cyclohydrolase II